MCKHILRVQFILIDGFQDDLSKKKISPIYIPVHAARPGRTDMLFFFEIWPLHQRGCSRENVSLLTISQHTWRCLSSQQVFSWRFTTLYMQNWHRNCSKLRKRPMQQWGRFLAFFMEYCNDNLLIMSQHDSGVYFWCADWYHGLKFRWHFIDPGKKKNRPVTEENGTWKMEWQDHKQEVSNSEKQQER